MLYISSEKVRRPGEVGGGGQPQWDTLVGVSQGDTGMVQYADSVELYSLVLPVLPVPG